MSTTSRARRLPALAAFAGVLVAGSLPADAQSGGGRTVKCRIESAGNPPVNGQCLFKSEAGGSFSLENTDVRRSLVGPSILNVMVTVTKPGVAEVRGVTKAGINSRWGEAKRSRQDPACWQGADFKICAW